MWRIGTLQSKGKLRNMSKIWHFDKPIIFFFSGRFTSYYIQAKNSALISYAVVFIVFENLGLKLFLGLGTSSCFWRRQGVMVLPWLCTSHTPVSHSMTRFLWKDDQERCYGFSSQLKDQDLRQYCNYDSQQLRLVPSKTQDLSGSDNCRDNFPFMIWVWSVTLLGTSL